MQNNGLYPTTYRNGATAIPPHRRVFEAGGLLRVASDIELENGIVDRTILPNDNAAVDGFSSGDIIVVEAAGPISVDAGVFRATSGRVAGSGTSRLGRAKTATLGSGETVRIVVEPVAGGGGGGSGFILDLGNYNPTTNLPALTDATGATGQRYVIEPVPATNQSRNFGSGVQVFVANRKGEVYHNGSIWIMRLFDRPDDLYRGSYDPTNAPPAEMTDSLGKLGYYWEVIAPAAQQSRDLGSGAIVFPAHTSGRLIHSGTVYQLFQNGNRKDAVHGTTLTLTGSDLNWQLNGQTKDNVLFDLGAGSGNVNVNLTITGTVRPGQYKLYVTNVGTKQLVWNAAVWSGIAPQPIENIQTLFNLEVLPDGSIKGSSYTT